MKQTAADILVERLIDWGVDTIFGLPGDGINGIMEALRKKQDVIRFIQVRHEESAAFMACGYSKFTGRLGVCLATSGPGGIHLLNGLYDAKLDSQSVLAITGLQFHDLINTHTQQDVELDKLFQDVAIYNSRIMGPAHVEGVVDLACRTALAYKGVSHITFPVDMQSMEIIEKRRSERNVPHHGSTVRAASDRLPSEQDLYEAADILNSGKKVALLIGRGALQSGDVIEEIAEKLGAPIVKALLGKAAVPDTSPYTTGGLGLLGTKPSQEAMENCDTLFLIGTSFPYLEFYPKPGQAKAIQIDMDPMRIGLRYPVDVGLIGDAQKTLRALSPLLRNKEDKSFLKKAQEGMEDWWSLIEERGTRMDVPMKPQVVAWELGKRLSPDAIVTSDSGTITTWWARQIKAKKGQMFTCSGTLATMACGLAYAVSAQIAHPNRQCVTFIGDGGLSMLPSELAIGNRDDPTRILAASDPHPWLVGLDARRLPHLHDRSLHEAERDHVAAHPAHHDAITHAERSAPQNHDITRERGHDPLQGKSKSGCYHANRRGQARRIIEPYRADAKEQEQRKSQVDSLPRPEFKFHIVTFPQREA